MNMRCCLSLPLLFCAAVLAGCASSSETASRDTLTENVGKYPAPPKGITKARVGVPPFNVTAGHGFTQGKDLNDLAADQMSTLLDLSERFEVIERTQLQKLLNEQNMEGIVTPGELAKPGQVRGVDFLLLGKVTNLRMKTEHKDRGFGFAKVGSLFGGADYKKKDVTITSECGVDIRLVDPTTGQVWASNFSEFKREDSASAIGVEILGANAQSDADIQISEDDKGKILRLALDDAVRKSLPKIDKSLMNRPAPAPAGNGAAPSNPGASIAAPVAPAAVATKKFCPQCGKEVQAGVKFCPSCGGKIE